ncbi:prepilin peptidase [Candidatus Dependentiae bacterium]|nr:prepilin peptidase [Candidatus Dependentiae bacterium]
MTSNFLLLFVSTLHFFPYFILFSALGITIVTDLSTMLISRLVSLYLVPIGFLLSYYKLIDIHLFESICAALAGYLFFYMLNKLFFYFKKQNCLGEGDFDLMALIGSFTGFLGIWFSIFIGSLLGTVAAITIMLYKKKYISYMPFGPFLSIATMIFILMQDYLY